MSNCNPKVHPVIHALDFDGVICDSAVETGISGWKTARKIWDNLPTPLPPEQLIEKFRQVRPVLETGYESVLLMRLLHDGETVESVLNNFSRQKQQMLADDKLDIAVLKKLFSETRDHWISNDLENWVEMNPLFSGIAEKLQKLDNPVPWYIITTKQERFVEQILIANQIDLARENIFGMDRNMGKNTVLSNLVNKHPDAAINFVEDRLPTLQAVQADSQLSSVKLFFALWGYNTWQDKSEARENKSFNLINLADFLN